MTTTAISDTTRSTVFVYGSLKRGFHNHLLLGDPSTATFMGTSHIKGRYRMSDLGAYPGLYKHNSFPETVIVGEVYRVNQDVMRALDILEGNEFYYTRQKIPTLGGNGPKAWCYFLPFSYGANTYVGNTMYTTAVQCWRPTPEEHAYILTLGATLVEAPLSSDAISSTG